MTDLSGDEMVALFEQHLTFLREVRDTVSAHVATSREMVGRSPLIVQIDEQISRMEREVGAFGSNARRGPRAGDSHLICQAVLAARRSKSIGDCVALCADGGYASDLAMPRFTRDNTRDLSDAQVAELNERYERSIKWLTPDLPNYNGMCDHIAENVLCAYEVSQIFKRTMRPP